MANQITQSKRVFGQATYWCKYIILVGGTKNDKCSVNYGERNVGSTFANEKQFRL